MARCLSRAGLAESDSAESGSLEAGLVPVGYSAQEQKADRHHPEPRRVQRPERQARPQELTEDNLRLIQEIELLPSGDVALTPHDTLHPEAWEAWYPATVERIGLAGARELRVPLSNWYSWRESMVLWPPVYDRFARKGKLPRMHPILQSITDFLRGTWNSLTSYNAGDRTS